MFNPLFFLSVGLIFLSLILSARYRKSSKTLHRIEVIGITSLVLVVLIYFFGLYEVPSFWTAIVLLAIIIVAFVVIIWSSINIRKYLGGLLLAESLLTRSFVWLLGLNAALMCT